MKWVPELITDGEIDALRLVASQAWGEDTRYPKWRGSSSAGGGQCYVTAAWLQSRLGGYIGKKAGHFAWLSPDLEYVLDLTGDHSGIPIYKKNSGYAAFDKPLDPRADLFIKRANSLFSDLPRVVKVAVDSAGGDAFPGEEPERATLNDQQYWHDEPRIEPEHSEYKFFYANGNLEIAPSKYFNHDDLKSHVGIDDDYAGPMAIGYATIKNGKVTWQVHTNTDLNVIVRELKSYSKDVGWDWNGLTDIDGEPVSDDFGPSKKSQTLNYVYSDGHLYIGKLSHAALSIKVGSDNALMGLISISGKRAVAKPAYTEALEALFEWTADNGLVLCGSSNNLIERNETMEQKDLGIPDDRPLTNPVEQDAEDDSPMPDITKDGVNQCPVCNRIFGDEDDYEDHRVHPDSYCRKLRESDEVHSGPSAMKELPDPDRPVPFDGLTPQQPAGTFPIEGSVKVHLVSNVKNASRVDNFDYDAVNGDDYKFYVAHLSGSPVGYIAVGPDNELKSIQSNVTGRGVIREMMNKVESYHDYLYTHITDDSQSNYFKNRGWVNARGSKWIKSAAKEPGDLIEASIPFVYDIPADQLNVGNPGQKTSDVPGEFSPGGIVEGEYAKGGKVTIYTATNMPYSVNHLLSLWYNIYPEMIIKNVFLDEGNGQTTRLASK